MGLLKKKSAGLDSGRFGNILIWVFGVAFAVFAVALTYQAANRSNTDTRSRAASDKVVIKRWDFESGKEGWKSTGDSAEIKNNSFVTTFPNNAAAIQVSNDDKFSTNAPFANKEIVIRVSARGAKGGVLGATDNSSDTTAAGVIPNEPAWLKLVPAKLRNFIELLYMWVFVYKRPTDMAYLLEGITGDDTACVQVIQPAVNKQTGECRQFSTPCDVPSGWEKVNQCDNPTCVPRPACADGVADDNGEVIYCDPAPGIVWCPKPTATPAVTPTATPKPTCTPRPACLDNNPPCAISESENICPEESTVQLRIVVSPGSSDAKKYSQPVSIPIDGTLREYTLKIPDTMDTLSLNFSRNMMGLFGSTSGPYGNEPTTIAIDWLRVQADPLRAEAPCKIAGCNGELCINSNLADQISTICLAKPEYACYNSATCKTQANGQCGWTQTAELKQCLAQYQTVCWNFVGEGSYWPNGCKGNIPRDGVMCTMATVPLTDAEKTAYQAWVAAGSVVPEGCNRDRTPTPTPTPGEGCHYQDVQCIQAPCDPILVCPTGSCQNLWWFDKTTTVCAQKQFCGAYAYEGLKTFNEKSACETALSNRNKACVVTGCSSQICADQQLMSTCEYREVYACYQGKTCARQSNGDCGWTMTDELRRCIEEKSQSNSTQ